MEGCGWVYRIRREAEAFLETQPLRWWPEGIPAGWFEKDRVTEPIQTELLMEAPKEKFQEWPVARNIGKPREGPFGNEPLDLVTREVTTYPGSE